MPTPPKKPAPAPGLAAEGATSKLPKHAAAEEPFIGHEAPTVVDASLAKLKQQRDEQRARAAAADDDDEKTPPPEDAPSAGPRDGDAGAQGDAAADGDGPAADGDDAAADGDDAAADGDDAAAGGDDAAADGDDAAADGDDATASDSDDATDGGGAEDLDPAAKLSVADLEVVAQVKLPPRLRAFFEDGDAAQYEGWCCPALDIASAKPLRFLAGELGLFWDFASDGYFELPSKRLAPIAVCGAGDGTFFVAADTASPELAVYFFDSEEGFSAVFDSFDGFLASLTEQAQGSDDEG